MATGAAGTGQVWHSQATPAVAQASRLMDGLQQGCWPGSTQAAGSPFTQALRLLGVGQHDSARLALWRLPRRLAGNAPGETQARGWRYPGAWPESSCEQFSVHGADHWARLGRRQRGRQVPRPEFPSVCSQQKVRSNGDVWPPGDREFIAGALCLAGGPGEPSCAASGSADMEPRTSPLTGTSRR